MRNVVLECRNPMPAGRDLNYEVKVREGQPPAGGWAASLFIDIVDGPITPIPFAVADRRMWRRAVAY